MSSKVMFKNENSCIVIKEDKLYVMSTRYKDLSVRAFTILNGFQIELGRSIKDFEAALREARLPIMIKMLQETSNNNIKITYYQIIRMHTGKVDDKIIATIVCKNDIITVLSFNRGLIKDGEYRRYNQLSVLHQISLPYDLSESSSSNRNEQVVKTLKTVMPITNSIVVNEKEDSLVAITKEDNLKLKFTFISNAKNNKRFELISIALAE